MKPLTTQSLEWLSDLHLSDLGPSFPQSIIEFLSKSNFHLENFVAKLRQMEKPMILYIECGTEKRQLEEVVNLWANCF